jgi:hypothetical protein
METKNRLKLFVVVFSILFVFYLFNVAPSVVSWGPLNNYRNFSVRTTVNITNAMPEILNITCNNGSSVTLIPGSTQNVTCIIQIRDYNGGITIDGTNGSGVNTSTLYYFQNSSQDPDDNNVHYTNSSCSVTGTASGYYINWSCGFNMWYYSNNGTWRINVTVHDRYQNTSYNVSSERNTSVNSLYAINVTDVINFGDMSVGDVSANPAQANITNFGNMRINISLYGFGADNQTRYGAYAMICEIRNLTLNTERYSIVESDAWAAMTPISGTPTKINSLSIVQQEDDVVPVVNSTYWKLYIDPVSNPFGQCNGTVIFSAITN